MEKMVNWNFLKKHYEGKRVFVTGHTGFKGAWLIQILSRLGASIYGYALDANKNDLFEQIEGEDLCESSIIEDIRDKDYIEECILDTAPDYIFHLAAQSLVLEGYKQPLDTFEINVMGTANVLEALRKLKNPCIALMITTDKVYENLEQGNAFVESDKLGGYDPYAASKAACEIVIDSYKKSFFNMNDFSLHNKAIASLRAGNVIGGGDFAENRIIPDIIRALKNDENIMLRNPNAIRPWQHVLEPLAAYLLLGAKMQEDPQKFATAYNIGPEKADILSVEELSTIAIETAQKGSIKVSEDATKLHEAKHLALSIEKIKNELNWKPKWNAKTAIEKTISWYFDKNAPDIKCLRQIDDYFETAIKQSDEN